VRGRELRALASGVLLLLLGYGVMLDASALLAWGLVTQWRMLPTEAVIASVLLGFVGYAVLSLWALSVRSRPMAMLCLILLWLICAGGRVYAY